MLTAIHNGENFQPQCPVKGDTLNKPICLHSGTLNSTVWNHPCWKRIISTINCQVKLWVLNSMCAVIHFKREFGRIKTRDMNGGWF